MNSCGNNCLGHCFRIAIPVVLSKVKSGHSELWKHFTLILYHPACLPGRWKDSSAMLNSLIKTQVTDPPNRLLFQMQSRLRHFSGSMIPSSSAVILEPTVWRTLLKGISGGLIWKRILRNLFLLVRSVLCGIMGINLWQNYLNHYPFLDDHDCSAPMTLWLDFL